jgi:hypothetical protein
MKSGQHPWASGPREILAHGFELIRRDTDADRRIAMILIDNAVELMIKTYLGLPSRVTGINIPFSRTQEVGESFPRLLEAMEMYAPEKIIGLDLGEIEWYHRLRNQLYHQGNGLTVEREKLTVYSQIAKTLFTNLFGLPPDLDDPSSSEPLAQFLSAWARIEASLGALASKRGISGSSLVRGSMMAVTSVVDELEVRGALPRDVASDVLILREIRNKMVHAPEAEYEPVDPANVRRARQIAKQLESLLR